MADRLVKMIAIGVSCGLPAGLFIIICAVLDFVVLYFITISLDIKENNDKFRMDC
jgi:hypothetical protein